MEPYILKFFIYFGAKYLSHSEAIGGVVHLKKYCFERLDLTINNLALILT
jgi:hypothetical protein